MAYNALGRKRFWTSIAVLFITILNLGLSGVVNKFNEFFYVADQFPFALSIITLVMYGLIFAVDLNGKNSFIVKPPFLLGFELLLIIFWTAGNSFSTSRWRHIPLACDEIEKEFDEERHWCKSLQALKSFVWIEWVILVLVFFYTAYYLLQQHRRGNNAVWSSALSRETGMGGMGGKRGVSEFLQYPGMAATPTAGSPGGAYPFSNKSNAGAAATRGNGGSTGSAAAAAAGPTPIADAFQQQPAYGHRSQASRGRDDMTQHVTATHKSQLSGSGIGEHAAAAPAQAETRPYVGAYARPAAAVAPVPAPVQQPAYAAQDQYYTQQPELPPQQTAYGQQPAYGQQYDQYDQQYDQQQQYGQQQQYSQQQQYGQYGQQYNQQYDQQYAQQAYGQAQGQNAYATYAQDGYAEAGRDSIAGGPGLAGVGARAGPAPGAHGGFERM